MLQRQLFAPVPSNDPIRMAEPITRPEDWTPQDTARAKEIWARYQREHDLTDRKGDAAGIDPRTGEVWLGTSALDISNQRRIRGLSGALFFERIGYPSYVRKGRR